MDSPRISIVTPSLNQGRFIEACIDSVRSQNYPNIEHIVIDGGSTDGTLDVLKRHTHLHWTSEADRGQSHAINKGFAMATGAIIGWLNADDTYCADVFGAIAREFEHPGTMVVCGDGFEIDSHGDVVRTLSSRAVSPHQLVRYWKWQYEFVQPAFFFRRGVFREVGYLDESLYYAMDFDLLIRLGKQFEIHHIDRPVANLRLHDESKTGKVINRVIPAYVKEMQRVSVRYWGRPTQLQFYRYGASFVGALLFSVVKNALFVKDSKSRAGLERLLGRIADKGPAVHASQFHHTD